MKKLFLTSLCLMLPFGAFASDALPQPPMGGPNGDKSHGEMDMMAQLTDEQKSCVQAYGCTMPEKPEKAELGEKPSAPSEKPEMTQEQQESMDCMRKAMESCGIEMPKAPAAPNGERPELPNGAKPEMPQNNAQ